MRFKDYSLLKTCERKWPLPNTTDFTGNTAAAQPKSAFQYAEVNST